MAVEIKSWRDGKVLFTAKNAADVREAVQEAVREKADLRSADLRYADLGSANLGYADLRYANLGSADLRYANLGYADLGSANLRYADLGSANFRYADLRSADLGSANFRYANLGYADLRYANLRYADLGSANFRYADLRSADLGSANFRYADLRYAKGLQPERVNDLLMLLDQVGKIRMYKLVDGDYMSPIHNQGRLKYEIGATVKVDNPDTDPLEDCGAGINLATLPWCLTNWQPGHRVLVMEFTAKDVAAIPVGDGKFRVSKAKVIREVPQEQVHGWLGLNPDGSVVVDES